VINEIYSDGAEIERMLTPLIAEHGIETVRLHLAGLFHKSKWADYQRVLNFAERISKRLVTKTSFSEQPAPTPSAGATQRRIFGDN
jgi:hypothetical protein